MTQIRENWTDLVGELVTSRRCADKPGFVELELRISEARDVPGFESLLHKEPGERVVVLVREEWLSGTVPEPGSLVEVRARRGRRPDQAFGNVQHLRFEKD